MLVLSLLTGCSAIGSFELGDRLIIEAIGIDSTENGFEVTVLALNTQQSGAANSTETPDGVAKIFSAKGQTLASAFAEIDLISGQVPLYSQARVIILGRELTENMPMSALNYFVREYTTRDDILLAAAQTSAKQIISIHLGDNVLSSKVIHSMLQSGAVNGMTVPMPMYRFISKLLNDTDAAVLPLLQVIKKEDEKNPSLQINGSLLFAKDNSTVTLNNEQTKGFLFADNKFKSGSIEFEYNNSKVVIAVQRSRTELQLTDKINAAFRLDVHFSCDIIEYNAPSRSELDMETLSRIRVLAEQKVKNTIADTLQYAVHENACDLLSFGRILQKESPDAYDKAIADYSSFLRSVPVEIQVNAKITRTGKEILPFD